MSMSPEAVQSIALHLFAI